MPAPLIGITSNLRKNGNRLEHRLGRSYTSAILAAGGFPVILSVEPINDAKGLLSRLDGILFSGGVDIDPARFNGNPHPQVEADEIERDEMEIVLVRQAVNMGKPLLGICRGCQVINVALGGTLYTHISDQYPGAIQHDCHDQPSRSYIAHGIRLDPHSRLAQVSRMADVKVNSLHHQAINQLAPGLTATGWCQEDGLIEAVEIGSHPYALAVQWHPEELQDRAEVQALFGSFIQAAESHHEPGS